MNMQISPFYYLAAVIIGIVLLVITKKWYIAILISYMFLVLAATVLARTPTETAKYNLTLFWSYGEAFKSQQGQVFGNIIMFIPIGMMLGFFKKIRIILYGFFFSVFIEVLQLISHRGMFEFDDIVHNMVGLVLGVAVSYVIFMCLKNISLFRMIFIKRGALYVRP